MRIEEIGIRHQGCRGVLMRNGANHSKHHKCKVTRRVIKKCSSVRVPDTTRLRKMCVRATRCAVFTFNTIFFPQDDRNTS